MVAALTVVGARWSPAAAAATIPRGLHHPGRQDLRPGNVPHRVRGPRDRYGQPGPPPKQVAKFTGEVVVPTLQTDVLDKLRALTPPEGDEQKTTAVWDVLQRGIDTPKADPTLLTEDNTGGAFDQANSLAQAYGFKQCGSG
jgi:hypothetical protein